MVHDLYGDKAPSTWNVVIAALKAYSEELIDAGVRTKPLLPENVKFRKVPKRLPKPVPEEEVSRILEEVDDEQDLLLLEVLVASGMRASEAGSIKFGDISPEGIVTVIGKGDKERRTFLTQSAFTKLKAWAFAKHIESTSTSEIAYWQFVENNPERGVFLGADGREVIHHANPADWVYSRVKKYTEASPHRFRHFWVTDLLNNGANLMAVMDAAGHESVATTRTYKKVLNREMAALRSKHSREQGTL